MNRYFLGTVAFLLGGCITKPMADYKPQRVSSSGVSEASLICKRIVGSSFDCTDTLRAEVEKCLKEEVGISLNRDSKNTISVEMKAENEAPTIPFWANILTAGIIPYSYVADESTTITIATPTSKKQYRAVQQTKEERGWWYAISNGTMGYSSDIKEKIYQFDCAGITGALRNAPID